MVDTMIQGQLGSLTSSTPSAPSWEAKRDEVDRMEEGKKPEELMPMYMEGRDVQAGGFGSLWSRYRVPVLVGTVLLLGLFLLVGPIGGMQTSSEEGAGSAVKTVDMPEASHLEPADIGPNASTPSASDTTTAKAASSVEAAQGEAAPAAATAAAAAKEVGPNTTEVANESASGAPEDPAIASYKAACPTLLKLRGACDYDLSADDPSLHAQTLVRNVCPTECGVVDRYRKMCPSLMKLDGGCAHDLSIEEDLLPHGTFVRIVCPEKCETTTTSTTLASTVPAETTRQELRTAATSTSALRGDPFPERTQKQMPETEIPGKVRPSRWLGYLAGLGTTAAWVALCIREQRLRSGVSQLGSVQLPSHSLQSCSHWSLEAPPDNESLGKVALSFCVYGDGAPVLPVDKCKADKVTVELFGCLRLGLAGESEEFIRMSVCTSW
ncbi:KLHL8 [Symbiodinium sp. CCMP2592]|nr:KLHL8 [Symbiodinium sp. CCMP2592]